MEEGCNVRAYELLRDAAGLLRSSAAGRMSGSGFTPGLVVADLSQGKNSSEVDQLSELAQRVPVWVIASHRNTRELELTNRGFERVFFRPVDMRDLVENIKRRIGPNASSM